MELLRPQIYYDLVPFDGTVPHRLSGLTTKNALPISRRVMLFSKDATLFRSTVTGPDGTFAADKLPPQTLDNPYFVVCVQDNPDPGEIEVGNALVFGQVYQVDDLGNPPS